MTIREVSKLHAGDEVTWTDPDNRYCTRTVVIGCIQQSGEVVSIQTQDGDGIEAYAHELS